MLDLDERGQGSIRLLVGDLLTLFLILCLAAVVIAMIWVVLGPDIQNVWGRLTAP